MTDLVPPSLDMWVFAGAGVGALLTWMIMRLAGGNAYQHGYDHGRSESEHELAGRLAALAVLERERAQLQEALARARAEQPQLPERLAPAPPAAGDPGHPPVPRG